MPKRKSMGDGAGEGTPKKARNDVQVDIEQGAATPSRRQDTTAETPSKQQTVAETPSKQRSILKNNQANIINGDATPKSLRKVLFSTPAKALETVVEIAESPLTAARNADQSARKKSSRKLFLTRDDVSDEGEDVGEDIARQILNSEDEDGDGDGDGDDDDTIAVSSAPNSPSKDPKPRGRPKGKRRVRSPTPPDNLPPHELYFFQNRPAGVKTSANTLPSSALLNHDDYFAQINSYKDPHQDDCQILTNMHKANFEQWLLELDQGFNICLYGYGSKKQLLLDFADHLYNLSPNPKKPAKIVVVNGYNPTLNLRDILATVSTALLGPSAAQKLPQQPTALLDTLLSILTTNTLPKTPLHLIIHSIDAPPLRKHQLPLSRLASCPHITLTASADTPTFPLLWDISLRSAMHFVFHDTTTFAPFTSELDPVDQVNNLLGRSGRRVGGKDGVAYVLRSLPENARNLYRILVAEQLALADVEGDAIALAAATAASSGTYSDDDDDGDDDVLGHADGGRFDMTVDNDTENDTAGTPSKKQRVRRGRPAKKPKLATKKKQESAAAAAVMQGVEYRTLYHKAVEEFVSSSEMSFRTLLKEFHDHDMLESHRDAQGTERLSVPFAREELEEILAELV